MAKCSNVSIHSLYYQCLILRYNWGNFTQKFVYLSSSNASDIKWIVKVDYLGFVCLPILQKKCHKGNLGKWRQMKLENKMLNYSNRIVMVSVYEQTLICVLPKVIAISCFNICNTFLMRLNTDGGHNHVYFIRSYGNPPMVREIPKMVNNRKYDFW